MLMEFEGVIELANNHYGRQKYLISPLTVGRGFTQHFCSRNTLDIVINHV